MPSESGELKKIEWREFYRLLVFVSFTFVVVLILGSLYRAIVGPVLFSIFLTYLLLPLTRFFLKLKFGRPFSAISAILVLVGFILAFSSFIIPTVYHQILILVQLVPTAAEQIVRDFFQFAKEAILSLGYINEASFNKALDDFSVTKQAAGEVQSGLVQLLQAASSLPSKVLNIALIPIITFFLLKDYDKISSGIVTLIPKDLLPLLKRALDKVDFTLKSVIKGQLITATILGIGYIIGLVAIGLPAGLAIGFVAGVCRLIPYMDLIVGLILSIVVLATHTWDWVQAIGVVSIFIGAQIVDGMFITPKFIGGRVGLHPGIVILSVIAFGSLMGFWGILLAIPIVAIAKVIIENAVPYYLDSSIYSAKRFDALTGMNKPEEKEEVT